MKITIVYDNEVYKKGLKSDWGFSCLLEAENTPKILFDTGARGEMLLSNMKELGIDPCSVDEIFISHAHRDHTGGLSDFLKVNKKSKIYAPPSFTGSMERETITISEPTKIHENVFSTGELAGIEQSLLFRMDKGLVVVAGCSHPGVGNILKAASKLGKVYALIGGLHGFREFNLIKGLEFVCPAHCTQFKPEIKSLYPEKYVEGGAGKVITL
jgi:7,8-dihydropterin-6-yl-methyl-4-(beta-D-ribofuranosyl)aminobenzene 5'-phosphate synthase